MTPLFSLYALDGVLGGALVFAVYRWVYWRRTAAVYRADADAILRARNGERQQASDIIVGYRIERDRALRALEEVDAIVTRRPPRRHWLAKARRIARLTVAGRDFTA